MQYLHITTIIYLGDGILLCRVYLMFNVEYCICISQMVQVNLCVINPDVIDDDKQFIGDVKTYTTSDTL